MYKETLTEAFCANYDNISIAGKVFDLKELTPGTSCKCAEEVAEALSALLTDKKISGEAAACVARILMFSATVDSSRFYPNIDSYHYEFPDCNQGYLVYWDLILRVQFKTLVLGLKRKPDEDLREPFLS